MQKIFEKYTDKNRAGSFSGLSGFKKNNKLENKNVKKFYYQLQFTRFTNLRDKNLNV